MTFADAMRFAFRTVLPLLTYGALAFASHSAQAAIGDTEIELDSKQDSSSQASPEELERARTVHASPAPPVTPQATQDAEYFYRYRNAITIRAGAEDARDPGPLLGFFCLFSTKNLRSFEAGADLVRDSNGVLHFSVFNLSGRDRFRWFHKYGIGIRVVAEDRLATFLRLKHWTLRGGGGFEYSLQDRMSLRVDLEALASTQKLDAQGSVGLSFAW